MKRLKYLFLVLFFVFTLVPLSVFTQAVIHENDWELGQGIIINHFGDTINTGIREMKEFPKQFALYQNYPNPFHPSTIIEYEIKERTHVKLEIYNALGQICDVLVNRIGYSGRYREYWNPKNLPNGMYFSRLTIGEAQTEVRKMILLK
jgi:hypothetical protein